MDEPTGSSREAQKSDLHIMWNGVWIPIGEVEFLSEAGKVVKVLSFTPKEFTAEPEEERDIILEDVRRTDTNG